MADEPPFGPEVDITYMFLAYCTITWIDATDVPHVIVQLLFADACGSGVGNGIATPPFAAILNIARVVPAVASFSVISVGVAELLVIIKFVKSLNMPAPPAVTMVVSAVLDVIVVY